MTILILSAALALTPWLYLAWCARGIKWNDSEGKK